MIHWEPINDGYGYIGWGWDCPTCKHVHNFVVPQIDTYVCEQCHSEHESDFEDN